MIAKEAILQYMKEHGGITTAQAFYDLGCSRLSGRIYDLRHDGIPIKTEMIYVPNRYGKASKVALYTVVEEEENG